MRFFSIAAFLACTTLIAASPVTQDTAKAVEIVERSQPGGPLSDITGNTSDQSDNADRGSGNGANQAGTGVTKYFLGDTSKETVIQIPQGQLYLVRPLSPKGYSELIFRDAAASIRRTGQQYQYQLAVQRVYEEGEEELLEEDEDGDDGVGGSNLNSERDEKIFLLDESLHFRANQREGGETVFAWRDLSGDLGDLYEFVCDTSVKGEEVDAFQAAAVQCQFERKFKKPHEQATDDELASLTFQDDEPIPSASPTKDLSPSTSHTVVTMAPSTPSKSVEKVAKMVAQTVAPVSAKQPESKETLAGEDAELHLFDFESGTFILQDSEAHAVVSEYGQWKYWLQISGPEKDWLGRAVTPDINPVFNFEYLSFIFNHYTEDGSAFSWLLRFKNQKLLERFQEGLMQALWEHLNEIKWLKTKADDREYVTSAFQDLTMEDADAADKDKDESEEESEDEFEDAVGGRSEVYDSDEEQEDVDVKGADKVQNSQLAVGYKHDRSFVVRGSKIGVFRHTDDNNVKFDTNISKVQTPKGQLFTPKKVMLHAEDANLVLQKDGDPNSLYRMDLETGKVVDEWRIHDDIPITTFAPENKYAQMSNEQTFLGLSGSALYRIDPRLAGNKLVESQLKQYAKSTKADFSAAATTANGYIAVGSNKGDVRMFDRLGINAKTHIPALGDPITGLDVSADGRWVLATTRTFLLLIDAMQKSGDHKGKLGFEKSFSKDAKPQPRRLALSPSHVAQMTHETKKGISFTPARFNTGIDSSETTIVTATGPFVVTWSMKKLLKGTKDAYNIKRYEETVMADDFRYGSDKNMIYTLPHQVGAVAKSQLKRPTRESIVGSASLLETPRRRTGGSRTSNLRNEIVNSPY